MKRMHLSLVCLFALLLLTVPCSAFALGLEVGAGFWRQSPSGTLGYEAAAPVDNLDLKSDMNFGAKYKPFARVKVELPLFLPNLYFMATPMEFKGSGNKTFTFGGIPITGDFTSKLKLDHYDLAFYYSLPFLNTATLGILNAEVGLNARVVDFDATVTDTTSAVSASKKLVLPIPMVYAGVQVKPVKTFSIEAEGRGIAYGANHYYDLIGRLKAKIFGPIFFSGGYRYETIKIEQSGIKADVKVSGPFVEAGLSF